MTYDEGVKKWTPSGSGEPSISKVQLFVHQQNKTHRIVARKIVDKEVSICVFNSSEKPIDMIDNYIVACSDSFLAFLSLSSIRTIIPRLFNSIFVVPFSYTLLGYLVDFRDIVNSG